MTKRCSSCKTEKELSQFNKSKSKKFGVHNQCRQCAKLWKPSPEALKISRQKTREWNRLKYSGFTQKEYEAKLKEQNYSCAICGTTDSGPMDFHADHDHKTGEKRGVLCHKCNTGLGLLKDDIEILCAAIEYLNNYTR
jgi:hypothetical protein